MSKKTNHIEEVTLGNLIGEQAYKMPDSTAIKFKDQTLTYKQLNEQANQLAGLLIARNIKTGDTIGLSVDRSIEMVICLLAIIKAGAAYVPLDPIFPAERLTFMLADSGAKFLLTSKKYDDLSSSNLQKIFIEDAFLKLSDYNTADPDVNVKGTDLAYILYTSGSTGMPKGVQIEHQSLVNFLLSMQKQPGLKPCDILLAVTTISFDIAGLELYLPLITGALLIIADADSAKDGRVLLDMVRKEKVTVMQATPYTWRMMLESGWEEPLPLKVLCGGEALAKNLADQLLSKCSSLWNMYGPTETTIWSTLKQITSDDDIITIGWPIDNTQLYILDELLEPVEPGYAGEIYIGGDGVARGYLNRPELNDERFVNNPFSALPGQKLYRTGDLGKFLSNGDLQCLGRIDHQIKIRGYRIETEEIEHNLTRLDNVNEAVVVVHTDALENQRLMAYIVLKENFEKTDYKDEIATWNKELKNTLPDYMVPNDYVVIHSLPLTANGKIDRKALPEPVFTSHKSSSEYKAPDTATEKMIADVWMNYLGVKDISITDNFFELGGHSIIAVQIMVKIENKTGQRLPISTLFEYPTIEQLAGLVDNPKEATNWKSLVSIKPGGNKTPLYIIHGEGLNVLIFHRLAANLHTEQPVYGLQAVGLNGIEQPLDTIEALAARYVNEITEQNPTGPYAIAGYSFGGYIAFEMAKQFEAMGKNVKMLAMMDTNLKQHDGDNKAVVIYNKITRQFPKTWFFITSLIKNPSETIDYQSSIIKSKIQSLLGKAKPPVMEQPEDIPDYMDTIVNKLQQAVSNYKPTPYNGRVVLFKAKERIYFVDDFKYLGWKNYALKGVVINEVPGDHRVMLLPPFDKEFARILQQQLDTLDQA